MYSSQSGNEVVCYRRVDWQRRSTNPADVALSVELREQLEQALAALPEGLRVVFVLRDLQGFSTEETATILELGISAVKVRLHRARLRLRELLAAYFAEERGGS